MTSAPDRQEIAALIATATEAGARPSAACAEIGLSPRTLCRWQGPDGGIHEDRRPFAERPTPANKLSAEERDHIVTTCNLPEFASLPPSQIVPRLADQGTYIASDSSYYRVLRARPEPPPRSRPSGHPPQAARQHQRQGAVPGLELGYNVAARADRRSVLLPLSHCRHLQQEALRALHRSKQPTGLFRPGRPDRSASVGWEVHDRETAEFVALVLKRAVWSEKCLTSPLVLHADNGSPMKGATMKVTMERLGVTASFSRPRVSNDNPFSEALFRTCKYTPNWPTRGFATIEEAND